MVAFRHTLVASVLGLVAAAAGSDRARSDIAPPPEISCGSAELLLLAGGKEPGEHACIDVVFILDTTGSMGGLIEGAKRKIWSIAGVLLDISPRPYLRFGLVGYRDLEDDYVTRLIDLTNDLDAVYAELAAFEASGGGDTPEAVNEALRAGMFDIGWDRSPHTLRLAFLVGDAPPHMDYPGMKFPEILSAARDRDITVNALQAGPDEETATFWRRIAAAGHGYYARIPLSGGVRVVPTPFDDEIYDLQTAINATAIPYGDAAARAEYATRLLGIAGMPPAAMADRARAVSSMAESFLPAFGSSDLIDMLDDGDVTLDAVDRSLLPPGVSDLSEDELSALVSERRAVRRGIGDRLAALNRDRVAYLSEQGERDDESFDGEVKSILREQAAAKGFVYADEQ